MTLKMTMTLTPQILAMYLGCEVRYQYSDGTESLPLLQWSLHSIDRDGFTVIKDKYNQAVHSLLSENRVKPILRPLSSMTEEEKKELYKLVFGRAFTGDNISRWDEGKPQARWVLWSGLDRLFIYDDGDIYADIDLHFHRVDKAQMVLYLLSKRFDIFGLIEAGLAIECNPPPNTTLR